MRKDRLALVALCALSYFLLDAPLQVTGVLPPYAGIKNFLPFTLGLFFGVYGTAGCVLGCLASALVVSPTVNALLYECFCITLTGLGMFWGWYRLAKSARISFKVRRDYGRYVLLAGVLSVLCGRPYVSLAYFITGVFIGVPVNILFSSVLYIEPVRQQTYDAKFTLTSHPEDLDTANEIIEATAETHSMNMKRTLELQSCLEEISARIFGAMPETKIYATVLYGEAISLRMTYEGRKYNPFRITADDDEIDIMSLKIIKHRAIRASFGCSGGINTVHVVV